MNFEFGRFKSLNEALQPENEALQPENEALQPENEVLQPGLKREYEIIRSKRKTLAIEITRDCRVLVRAPLFVSEKRIKAFIVEKESWIEKALIRQNARAESRPELSAEEIEELRLKAKEILPKKVEYYSDIMGVKPTKIGINSAKTRFGSCTSAGSIHFSLYLMSYPEKAVDYVVVHEIAHLIEHNHSKAFYSEIEKILPDYKERIKLLK